MESQRIALPIPMSLPRLLDIVCRTTSSGTVVEAIGEIDYTSASLLRDRLDTALEGSQGGLTLDLRSIAFIDSSGLSLLVSAHRALKEEDRSFRVLVRRGSQPARVLSLGRFESLLQLAHDPDE